MITRLAFAAMLASSMALAQAPETAPRRADQGPPDAGSVLTPREKAAAQAADQAKKDVDVAGIHLQVARLYLAGLHGLAGAPSTWDREHGVALFTQAQNALTDADRQLAELQGLAQSNWPEARDPLSRARDRLVRVQGQLRSLSVPLRTGGGQARSTSPSTRPGTSWTPRRRRWAWTRSCAPPSAGGKRAWRFGSTAWKTKRPPDSKQPGVRLGDQLPVPVRGEQIHGIGVDGASSAFRMDHRISQNVVDRVRRLRRRAKRVRMVAISENLPTAAQCAVHCLRDPDREPLDTSRERDRIARLDDQVQVIRLHGEVDEPEAVAFATLADAGRDHAEAGPGAKLRCLVANARGHVDRVPRRERRPADVWHASSGLLRTPRARPVPAAPAVPQVEPELLRFSSSH